MRLQQFITVCLLALIMACSNTSNQPANQKPDAPLNNSRWVLRELTGLASVSAEREVFIQFPNGEENLKGYAGCNNFFGGYEVNGNNLKLGPLGATRMMCEDMTVEDAFLPMLEKVDRFDIQGDFMTLYAGEEKIATFESVYLN